MLTNASGPSSLAELSERYIFLLLGNVLPLVTIQAPFLAFALFCNHSKKSTIKEFLVSLEKAVKRQLAEKNEVAQSDASDGVKVKVEDAELYD